MDGGLAVPNTSIYSYVCPIGPFASMPPNPVSDSPDDILLQTLSQLIHARSYPKTICPSEVARALTSNQVQLVGANNWRELMPRIRELCCALRDEGKVEILQQGVALASDTKLEDIKGPIRVRKSHQYESPT